MENSRLRSNISKTVEIEYHKEKQGGNTSLQGKTLIKKPLFKTITKEDN